MQFSQVAQFFEAISTHSSRIAITKILAELFSQASADEAALISYLTLGMLRAPYRTTQFNYAEKSMIKVVADLLGLEHSACQLALQKTGDIGLCITPQEWPYQDHHLSVTEIYNKLVAFEAISGSGSQEERSVYLKTLLAQVDAPSASVIVRIILGKLRLGFSEMTVLDGLSWMVTGDKSLHTILEHGYNLCADLGLIARTLKDAGVTGIEALKPLIGIPIRPAAAERLPSPAAVIAKIGPCVAQPKLDGFRLQIHIDTTQEPHDIHFFSRNLLDMSAMFPDLVAALHRFTGTSLIVEGEAILYDEERGAFVPFQETVKRKRKHNIAQAAQDMPLRLYLFDILYLNGQILLPLGHEQRRALLIEQFGHTGPDAPVQVISEQATPTVAALEAYFSENITQGLEGIVVKRPDAPYRPGKRNFNWIKLKRHQEGHLDDTLDVVVLGYNYGKGKRAHFGIGAFLVGVYNKTADRFETIAKVGTGLKDADWIDLKAQCDRLALPSKPPHVYCSPELAPDVWITPRIVVIVRADEITRSPLHTAGRTDDTLGLALRFPRFMGYSVDKAPEQATHVDEIKELYTQQFT